MFVLIVHLFERTLETYNDFDVLENWCTITSLEELSNYANVKKFEFPEMINDGD